MRLKDPGINQNHPSFTIASHDCIQTIEWWAEEKKIICVHLYRLSLLRFKLKGRPPAVMREIDLDLAGAVLFPCSSVKGDFDHRLAVLKAGLGQVHQILNHK